MTIRAAYVPVLAVGKRLDFVRDYLTRRRETEGGLGETVETIDQKVELQRSPCVMKQCWPTASQVLSDTSRAIPTRTVQPKSEAVTAEYRAMWQQFWQAPAIIS